MLTEAELQKQWENLTFTDDFIFSRVMRNKRLRLNPSRKRPQGRFPENSTTGVLRGRQPLSSAGGRGGFRRGKTPLLSRGGVPS